MSTPTRPLVVIDDDPTGTQAVSGLPVIMAWDPDDIRWALSRSAEAVYVQTNSRALAEHEAVRVTREVADAFLRHRDVTLVSRGDSTLRGHFPAEPRALADAVLAAGGEVDAIVLVPAFPDAGRVTVRGVHYVEREGRRIPAGESAFAADATFGYAASDLRDWVVEKSRGRYRRADVGVLAAASPSADDAEVERLLADGARVLVVDAESESDLRAAAAALAQAEARGRRFVYRVAPPFVRALLGMPRPATLQGVPDALDAPDAPATEPHGLIVVGSHVSVTAQQLMTLTAARPGIAVVELSVDRLREDREDEIARVAAAVGRGLGESDIILQTSRRLRVADSPEASLALSASVSVALSDAVARALEGLRPAFVIAKGGITSSDVATRGLGMRRATIVGPMLPGMVSLWRIEDGPFVGLPFVVFPGNVGDASALLTVVDKLAGAYRADLV